MFFLLRHHRPAIRPAHQRQPQPDFVFPATPPSTAGLEAIHSPQKLDAETGSELFTPTPRQSPPRDRKQYFGVPSPSLPMTRHHRAVSDGTIQDHGAAKETDSGAFKIVISKPGEDLRPRTAEDVNTDGLLDVSIPSWRIGVPRFTSTGTPLIRGSSYAPSEVSGSYFDRSQNGVNFSMPGLGSRRPSTLKIPQANISRATQPRSPQKSNAAAATADPAHPLRLTYMSSRVNIEPAMYDSLTFKPSCDDRLIVRYASSNGAVTAATPPRLVAEITSPSFLDYELISDFFLTFRTFLEPDDLLRMLIARLKWAVGRGDETGMIVHVRAFVALRHWVLNYFVDDFVIDYDLRVSFCSLVNDYVNDLAQDRDAYKVQLKIINELKKCWRRVCVHYWDITDFDDASDVCGPIVPGGIVGNRDPDLDPTLWEQQEFELPRLDTLCPVPEATVTSFFADVSRAGHVGDSIVHDRPTTPEDAHGNTVIEEDEFDAISPTSMSSLDVVSCSFPGMHMRSLTKNLAQPLRAHPISPSSANNQTNHVAPTPKTLVGKRVRPTHSHQHNESLPDSLRELNPNNASSRERDPSPTGPSVGDLVRGNGLPPSQPFVDMTHPAPGGLTKRQTTVFRSQAHDSHMENDMAGAVSSRGMKRLLGSVRRALSTRHQAAPMSHGPLTSNPAYGLGSSATDRLPGTAVVPQTQNQPNNAGPRPPVRIDLLGAKVADDFQQAVREDAALETERYRFAGEPPKSAPLGTRDPEYSAAYHDSSASDGHSHNMRARPASDTALSGGSKSILIVDGTVPINAQALREGLTTANTSVEAFVENFVQNFGNITPPTTPPTHTNEVLRRSSHLLNENMQRTFADGHDGPLPAFIPDFQTLGRSSSSQPSVHTRHDSRPRTQHSRRHPPVSAGIPRMHRRHRSSRTQQSLDSVLHNRGASLSSDVFIPSTVQSFREASWSQSSMTGGEASFDPYPKPLRALRRQPGGNLRDATNVGDLNVRMLRRSHSLGSLSIYSESVRSSRTQTARRNSLIHIDSMISAGTERNAREFSVGQLAAQKTEISLCSTSSSIPIMRPSFEAEAKKLAQIPDDEDDGGVESALLKLEGKFEKRSVDTMDSPRTRSIERTRVDSFGVVSDSETASLAPEGVVLSVASDASMALPSASSVAQNFERPYTHLDMPHKSVARLQSFLSDASKESYSSIPLLDRGLTDDERSRHVTRDWTDRSVLQDSDDEGPSPFVFNDVATGESAGHTDDSYEIVHKTESMARIQNGHTVPSYHEEQSFLDSDLSSELSDESTETRSPGHQEPSFPGASHDGDASLPNAFTGDANVGNSANYLQVNQEEFSSKPLPPTPAASPLENSDPLTQHEISGNMRRKNQTDVHGGEPTKYSIHLPFVLAFDSETLAQQFTLIEKDALSEIDWKGLVEMEWKNTTNSDSRSWVDFLRNADAHGVEVVIARFNLVVKWAISEIVLTKHIEERAKCIIKFIHIASHCRSQRNYATLAQLTLALSSNAVSRLARTWELVAPSDMKTLSELEALVTPMRNFFNLRAEMELVLEGGCIPFLGIYTQDLLYNGQRPAEIASSLTTAPLVNFERCRTGAAVIKSLLRLLESSTQYQFQPMEGVIERCLWIGALSDEEIRRHSGTLE